MRHMSHRATGVYTILERPRVYERLQSLLGGPRALLRFVDEVIEPVDGTTILDVGCGTGSLLAFLPPGVRYTGFDLNPAYIDAARQRFGDRGRFFLARVGEEPPELEASRFDRIVAVALLHHLTDAEADHLLRTARRLLAPGGAFVSIDPTLHEGQSWLSAFMARRDRGGAVRAPQAYQRLVAAHFGSVDSRVATDMLRIPYSHWIARATA